MCSPVQIYQIGQCVEGRIERLLSYGLFLLLDDGTRAYIRRRELTWSGNIDPRTEWRTGERIAGIVRKLPEGDTHLELSHRATTVDPWDEFSHRYKIDDVVAGTVKSLTDYGIYVEILPGVDGLILLQDLAAEPAQNPEEVVWIGDLVEAVITQLEPKARKLKLSIRQRLEQLKTVATVMTQFNLFSSTDTTNRAVDEGQIENGKTAENQLKKVIPTPDSILTDQIGPILVIDDHVEIRRPLVEWLRRRGCDVDEAGDAREAMVSLETKMYGLLFVDLDLPEVNGLSLIRQVRSKNIESHIVIMSTAEWLDQYYAEIEALQAIEVFIKPLDLEEIEQLLVKVGQGQPLTTWRQSRKTDQAESAHSFSYLTRAMADQVALSNQLQACLEQLVARTPAAMGIIFYLNPLTKEISIVACAGRIKLNEPALHTLIASPVRDVIVDHEQILENRMGGIVKERFRKLLDLVTFQACVAVPIWRQNGTDHALFLMHSEPNVFHRYHLREALAAGYLLAAAIEQDQVEQRFRSLNQLLLTGQLASGFGHEVYNRLSGMELQLRNLQTDYLSFQKRFDQANLTSGFKKVEQGLEGLVSIFYDLKHTVEPFQQLMRTSEAKSLNINDVLHITIALMQPLLREHKTKIEIKTDPNLPLICANQNRLHQVFLNIILNAVQQMALQPDSVKILSITTACQKPDKERPINLHFADTGPGIHRRLWEKIFELGFTTRSNGTGQGLYIARSLIGSLGGKLAVAQSIIAIGTTFLVELPVVSPQGEGYE